jgi:ComF family protein
MHVARAFSNSFFDYLYPPRCGLCATLCDEAICGECIQEFVPSDVIRHTHDGGPVSLSATLYGYPGRPGQAVRRLKYSRATSLGPPLSKLLAEGIARVGMGGYDLFVPIPIHWTRRCMRGFNQTELMCLGLPAVDTEALRRTRRTRPQAQLTREERLRNLEGAFEAAPHVAGKSVLLIDDVLTSGQTAMMSAIALLEAGATKVAALALTGEAF